MLVQLLRHSLAFVLIVLTITCVCAQERISKEATVDFLNNQFGGNDVLELKGKYLLINSFRAGEQVKEDKINIYDLNPESVRYSDQESLVIMKCFKDADGCVERKTIKVGRKAYRNRVTFAVESPESGEKIVKALHHLSMIHQDKKYQGITSFE